MSLEEDSYVMTPSGALALVDENTIGVCAILGSTYNGEFEDVKGLCALLEAKNAEKGWDVRVHVDGASGAVRVLLWMRGEISLFYSNAHASAARDVSSSSPRFCTPSWSGTSACPSCAASTCPATNTGWCTQVWAGSSSAARLSCRSGWFSKPTIWAASSSTSR